MVQDVAGIFWFCNDGSDLFDAPCRRRAFSRTDFIRYKVCRSWARIMFGAPPPPSQRNSSTASIADKHIMNTCQMQYKYVSCQEYC